MSSIKKITILNEFPQQIVEMGNEVFLFPYPSYVAKLENLNGSSYQVRVDEKDWEMSTFTLPELIALVIKASLQKRKIF